MNFSKIVVFYLLIVTVLFSQDYRERLFKDLELIIAEAKKENAPLLSPNFYESGMETYRDAEEMLKQGDDLNDITKEINEAKKFLSTSIAKANISRNTFINTLKAREDAQKVDAAVNAPNDWEDAEKRFRDAATAIEESDLNDAREYGFESEKLYRKSELNAIKVIHLQEVWNLLKQADEEDVSSYAPKTLERAKTLISNAEKELEADRYNTEYADELTEESKYETNHAFFIKSKIIEINDKDLSREELLLEVESPLKRVGEQISYKVKFDEGLDAATNGLIEELNNYVSRTDKLLAENSDLRSQLREYETRLGTVVAEKSELNEKVKLIEEFKRRVNEIEDLFLEREAIVLRDAEKVTIRLVSLKFSVGSSIIGPQHFDVLSRVQKSIEKFQNATVTVEGHTDSQGREEVNSELSQKRADAVMQYLKANLKDTSNKIFAIGYGEARPIANNENEAGREKNRRIDVVITPEM
ncbi:MAG: hypothetical protein SCALA702_35410 [Melioribacteraceae bacterium]|nr:MAG: hypothetical protein SCALA702_35410 [Melioribacteraceae bacterium]